MAYFILAIGILVTEFAAKPLFASIFFPASQALLYRDAKATLAWLELCYPMGILAGWVVTRRLVDARRLPASMPRCWALVVGVWLYSMQWGVSLLTRASWHIAVVVGTSQLTTWLRPEVPSALGRILILYGLTKLLVLDRPLPHCDSTKNDPQSKS